MTEEGRMPLNSVHSIALSGMQSAWRRLEAASHNVANWTTEGYRPQPTATVSQAPSEAVAWPSVGRAAGMPGEGLAEDLVAQRVALYEFKSNMQVFRTQQDMLGTLLDLQA